MTEHKDGFSVSTEELAGCARINVENLGRMVPALAPHPIYQMALEQIKAVETRLGEDE